MRISSAYGLPFGLAHQRSEQAGLLPMASVEEDHGRRWAEGGVVVLGRVLEHLLGRAGAAGSEEDATGGLGQQAVFAQAVGEVLRDPGGEEIGGFVAVEPGGDRHRFGALRERGRSPPGRPRGSRGRCSGGRRPGPRRHRRRRRRRGATGRRPGCPPPSHPDPRRSGWSGPPPSAPRSCGPPLRTSVVVAAQLVAAHHGHERCAGRGPASRSVRPSSIAWSWSRCASASRMSG